MADPKRNGKKNAPQEDEAPPPAEIVTFDELRAKPKPTRECPIVVEAEDGSYIERRMVFQAISPPEYDELLGHYPPTPKQKKNGLEYNPDTFGLALIAACSLRPMLTHEQVQELHDTGQFTRGEIGLMFRTCVDVCHSGLDVTFSNGASARTGASA